MMHQDDISSTGELRMLTSCKPPHCVQMAHGSASAGCDLVTSLVILHVYAICLREMAM